MKRVLAVLLAALMTPGALHAADIRLPTDRPRGVSAALNRTVVVGKVEQQCALLSSALGIKPEMTMFRVRMTGVQVESGSRLRRKGALVLLATEEPPRLIGFRARAVIEYRGDERGGAYWLRSIEKVE